MFMRENNAQFLSPGVSGFSSHPKELTVVYWIKMKLFFYQGVFWKI